jgi:hypothetical protein
MEEKIGSSGSQSSLLRLLRKMGFRYRDAMTEGNF